MITAESNPVFPSFPRWAIISFMASIWSMTKFGALAGCPKVCECKWRDGKEVVSCRDAHFIDIPRGLEPSTQVLDLRHNNLRILPKDSFVYTGLTNLQKVWLSFCNLMRVENGAFRKLDNVVELDLSNNFLKSVPTTALMDMRGLRELKIAHNSITFISSAAFFHTPELVQLDISHNSITTVEEGALRELRYLEVLDMSENKIQNLIASELIPLRALRVINIDGNPWYCDCQLKPLRKWLFDYGLTPSPPPVCSQPRWLFGQPWQFLDLEEFVCAPQVSAIAPRVLASEGENVTLVCQVQSEEDTTITWLAGDTLIQNSNDSVRYYVSEIAIPDYNSYMSNLTMTGVVPQDQGIYRCIAENRAGYSDVNITLQVSHEVAEVRIANVEPATYVQGGLVMGVSISIFILLVLCSLIYCKVRGGQSSQQEEEKADIPETSRPTDADAQQTTGYHIVPTNEVEDHFPRSQPHKHSWRTRRKGEGEEGDERDTGEGSRVEGASRIFSHYENSQGHPLEVNQTVQVLPSAPGSVSYVEIPKSGVGAARTTLEDQVQWKDVIAHSKGNISSGWDRSSSHLLITNSAQYPDLLDLPRPQGQDRNFLPFHTLNPSYCTMPRGRSKNCADTLSTTDVSEGQCHHPTAYATTSPPYDSEYRCSSALNLALSEAASQAYAQGHIPIGGHPLSKEDSSAEGSQDPQMLHYLLESQRTNVNQGCEQVSEGPDPYRFEYHAVQLEKFLQEYRSLQQQLQMMKQSYQAHRRTGSAPRLDCCANTGPPPTFMEQPYATTSHPPRVSTDPSLPIPPQPYPSPSQSSIHCSEVSQPTHATLQHYPSASHCYIAPPESFVSTLRSCNGLSYPCQGTTPSNSTPSVPYSTIPSHCHTLSPQSYTLPLQICPTGGGEGGGRGRGRGVGGGDRAVEGCEVPRSSREMRSSPLSSEKSISPPTVTFRPNGELSRPKTASKGSLPTEPLKSILKKTSCDANGKLQHPGNQWKS